MPDTRLTAVIDRARARLRLRAVVWGLAAGTVAATAVNVTAMLVAVPAGSRLLVCGVVAIAVAAWVTRANGRATPLAAARCIEEAAAMDNLIVTAVELREQPRPVPSDIQDEIVRQAERRIASVDLPRAIPLRQPVAVLLAVMTGAAVVLTLGADAALVAPIGLGPGLEARTPGIDHITVHVAPPPYSGRSAEVLAAPVQVVVVAGSRVRLVVSSAAEGIVAELAGLPLLPLVRGSEGFAGEWLAERSTAVSIRPAGGEARDAKFLSVIVVADAPPVVRVPVPGKDLAIAGAKGRLAIEVDAQDDLGLASLVVKFTKASGGGEALTFTEGEVPLVVDRADGRHWRGRATWVLDGLELSDGDVLVYRAIARDRNPNGRPVQSDQFLVEVGRLSGAVGSGFALPAEEKKYAISQQMVIYKTEQLIASVKSLPSRSLGEGWLEQNQLLGIEQRMVRAEVVFLGGGEVQDEVEEAAHSHELAEGRLENAGRAEMLRAINFMSRAEAQLNDGKAVEALVLEREALKSLERAFDRRRYFLRTLPDRSRIDTTRRLTGNLKDARSWMRDRSRAATAAGVDEQRVLMLALATAARTGVGLDASLAARVAALDPAASSLQQAAVALASATNDETRRAAVWSAMQAVTAHALGSLGSAESLRLVIDPLAGHLADEVMRSGKDRR